MATSRFAIARIRCWLNYRYVLIRQLEQNARNRPLDCCLKLVATIIARPLVADFSSINQISRYRSQELSRRISGNVAFRTVTEPYAQRRGGCCLAVHVIAQAFFKCRAVAISTCPCTGALWCSLPTGLQLAARRQGTGPPRLLTSKTGAQGAIRRSRRIGSVLRAYQCTARTARGKVHGHCQITKYLRYHS